MRYLKIILSSLALFMVYFWISVMLNSCNSNKANPDETADMEYSEDNLMDADGAAEEFEGEFESDADALADRYEEDDSDTENTTTYSDNVPTGDYTTSEQVVVEEVKAKPASKPKTTTTTSSNTYNGSSEYMVIAGSYLIKDNAQQMANKLSAKGYSAEIVNFDYSQYHSICAGRYESQSTAQKTAQNLKGIGIDAYVHRRQ